MIVFESIRWKNFLSTGNYYSEVKLNTAETTLIIGENGSGKSTILDALTYALFGKPFRKINKPQLPNSITKKDMVCEVIFTIKPHVYKIVRGIKPNIFEVYQNDKLLNQSAESKDYQDILENQILKINYKSFCQVVVLGSASFVPFMQLPAQQRREIIEDLLDLQIFSTMNILIKDKIAKNNDVISNYNNELKLLNEKIKLIKEHLLEIQNNNFKIIEEKKDRIEKTKENILDLKNTNIVINDEIQKLSNETNNEKKIENNLKKLSTLKHKIEAKLAVATKDKSFFETHRDCPTCKQIIDSSFKGIMIEEKNSEISNINDGLEKLNSEYEKYLTQLNHLVLLKRKLNELKTDFLINSNNIENLKVYINNLEEEISSLKKTKKISEDNKLIEFEKEIENVNNNISKSIEHKNVLIIAANMLKDGGIKAKIIKQYIPIINKLINKYLNSMDFLVQFELNEEFNETLKSRYRDEFSYASFSEGEKQKIDLALLFTWRALAKLRNSMSTNLLILDEILNGSMDDTSNINVMNILKGMEKTNSIFVISHLEKHKDSDFFDKTLFFNKKANFSTYYIV